MLGLDFWEILRKKKCLCQSLVLFSIFLSLLSLSWLSTVSPTHTFLNQILPCVKATSHYLLLALSHLLHPPLTFTLSLLPHLSGIVNLSPFWHTKSLSWVERRGGTAPAWIFQKAVILNMTLSSVLSLWFSILPCQTFLVRDLDGSYSHCLSWG